MRTSALFGAKNFEFFEIYGVSARIRGERVSQSGDFFGQGGGVHFSRFCADVFYGRSLTNYFFVGDRNLFSTVYTNANQCEISKEQMNSFWSRNITSRVLIYLPVLNFLFCYKKKLKLLIVD